MQKIDISDENEVTEVAKVIIDAGAPLFHVRVNNQKMIYGISCFIKGEASELSHNNIWVLRNTEGKVITVLDICDTSQIDTKAVSAEAKAIFSHEPTSVGVDFKKSYMMWHQSTFPLQFSGRYLYIIALDCIEGYRDKGYAVMLMREFCKYAKGNGLCDIIYVDVATSNQRMLDKYHEGGFRNIRMIDTASHIDPVIRLQYNISDIE
jgi:GNAT superfamily N-acetyltransferase